MGDTHTATITVRIGDIWRVDIKEYLVDDARGENIFVKDQSTSAQDYRSKSIHYTALLRGELIHRTGGRPTLLCVPVNFNL